MFQLQFFSRPSDEGDTPATAELGYDGSMNVETFNEDDIQAYLQSMDCIFGECLVIVSWNHLNDASGIARTYRKAFRTTRVHQD